MTSELEHLKHENAVLRERVRTMEEQLNFLGQHRMLAAGIAGERLVASLTGGRMTAHGTPHDIESGGQLIEVKFATLSRPSRTAPTLRWQWQKIYGERGGKTYDYLLLIGDADDRFRGEYRDPLSPYVFFLIPSEEARRLCVKGTPLGMVLNSNPTSARGSSSALFSTWQTTASEIERRFNLCPRSDPSCLRTE